MLASRNRADAAVLANVGVGSACLRPDGRLVVSGAMLRAIGLLLLSALAAPGAAHAQRVNENVVQAAEDAFGLSIGNERLGIYTDENVRGFSPSLAGNVRLEGVYFDRRGPLSSRLLRSATIRVGLTAQGYAFPAPSGIIDYTLRAPRGADVASAVAATDSWGRASLETDLDRKISETLAIGGGIARIVDPLAHGGDRRIWSGALLAAWTPHPGVNLTPFLSVARSGDEEAGPIVFTSGPFLPPRPASRRFYGQPWADGRATAITFGAIGEADLPAGVTLRAGAFRSQSEQTAQYSDLFVDTDRVGRATRLITAFPRQAYASSSGELRLVKQVQDGPRRHALLLSLRGRDRQTRYGGGSTINLGPALVGGVQGVPRPDFAPRPRTVDEVRHGTVGVGYQGVWPEVGEANLGLQRAAYQRAVAAPAGVVRSTRDDAWLWNANAAVYVRPWLTVFGGYTRGLEDGGSAPQNAENANAALPATVSRQGDLGVRLAFDRVRLVAAVFDIRKPSYGLDATNTFAPIGRVHSRGVEISVVATPAEGLRILTGVVVSRPRVGGGAEADFRPIGAVERVVRVSADYAPPRLPALSLDAAIGGWSARVAHTHDLLVIPARTVVDLGARYRFQVGDVRMMARLAVSNVTDNRSWGVTAGGGFYPEDPRRIVASLYADF